MKRNFYTDDFEDLIREKADQYRMYPSEKVWKEINRSLHSRRKWYWSGFILLLSGISYFAIDQLITPGSPTRLAKNITAPVSESKASGKAIPVPVFGTVPPRSSTRQRSAIAENAQQQNNDGVTFPDNTDAIAAMRSVQTIGNLESSMNNLAPVFDIFTRKEIVTDSKTGNPSTANVASLMDKIAFSAVPAQKNSAGNENEASTLLPETEQIQKFNWLQEFAVYELLAPKTKRTSLQFAFSPTINYRKLTGKNDAHMASDVKSIPIAMNVEGNLDGLVNHKPAIGFEVGSSILYAYDKNLTLKAGLQFNYSRYDILAYSSFSAEIATIALANNQFTAISDSITNYTTIRNFGGDSKESLKNQYFQLSVPVGMEYRLYGNGRLQVKVAGTIQPTYLMNRNSYLITTDYKNYTREPSLVRRWNVNTSAEAFVSYQAAGIRWQVGPQFRYQLLSSYTDEYPVKEYLMEYGIKVGVSKTIR